jgi:hypothetical protein
MSTLGKSCFVIIGRKLETDEAVGVMMEKDATGHLEPHVVVLNASNDMIETTGLAGWKNGEQARWVRDWVMDHVVPDVVTLDVQEWDVDELRAAGILQEHHWQH